MLTSKQCSRLGPSSTTDAPRSVLNQTDPRGWLTMQALHALLNEFKDANSIRSTTVPVHLPTTMTPVPSTSSLIGSSKTQVLIASYPQPSYYWYRL